jgi:glycosyltransferase involved in cell wall biosynthesis
MPAATLETAAGPDWYSFCGLRKSALFGVPYVLVAMKIAQVSPLFESVPPKGYGGTERVISYLTEELVRQGHEVTLFAAGNSATNARLVATIAEGVRREPRDCAWLAWHMIEMDQVSEMVDAFDVVHFHTDYLHFPLTRYWSAPHVTTVHGRLDLPEIPSFFRHFNHVPLVSISDSQRQPVPWANWCDTVYHGLPQDLYAPHTEHGNYFVFIGRMSPEKRVDRAIDIAVQCGMRLYIAAKIDKAEEDYFNQHIKPLLGQPGIEYVGEVGDREKRELLGRATALLFPIEWPEPFGMVLIESFACGTPVIAYRHGSVPELVEDGMNGFTVANQEEAVSAAKQIESIDRSSCRETFERRFTSAHMANNYLAVYRRLSGSS